MLALKEQHPEIRLIAVLPCESQADKWSAEQRERYFHILTKCNETAYVSRHCTLDCMCRRNRWLIRHASFVLAVYNGSARGGTTDTVRYAYEQR